MPRSPSDRPVRQGARRRLRCAARGFERNHQFITAGHLAFVGIFTLFPFLIVLVSVAGVVGSTEAAREALATALEQVPDDIARALGPVAEEVIAAPRSGTVTFGLLTALWAASSGFEALRYAFNRAYGVQQPRQLWQRRAQSLALTLVFALVVVLATLSVVVVPFVVDVAVSALDLADWRERGVNLASSGLGLGVFILATAAVYKVLPRPRVGWLEVLPGAVLAVLGWFVLASAFGFYLAEVATLSLTYGSLGGVVATLVFFYLTACVVLFGCEFNAAGNHADNNDAGPHDRP